MSNESQEEQSPRMVGDYELKDEEIYQFGAGKPKGKSADKFRWSPVYGLDPYGNKDQPSGWIGKPKGTEPSRKRKKKVGTGDSDVTQVWRHTDGDPDYTAEQEAKRRAVLGIKDPMEDD